MEGLEAADGHVEQVDVLAQIQAGGFVASVGESSFAPWTDHIV